MEVERLKDEVTDLQGSAMHTQSMSDYIKQNVNNNLKEIRNGIRGLQAAAGTTILQPTGRAMGHRSGTITPTGGRGEEFGSFSSARSQSFGHGHPPFTESATGSQTNDSDDEDNQEKIAKTQHRLSHILEDPNSPYQTPTHRRGSDAPAQSSMLRSSSSIPAQGSTGALVRRREEETPDTRSKPPKKLQKRSLRTLTERPEGASPIPNPLRAAGPRPSSGPSRPTSGLSSSQGEEFRPLPRPRQSSSSLRGRRSRVTLGLRKAASFATGGLISSGRRQERQTDSPGSSKHSSIRSSIEAPSHGGGGATISTTGDETSSAQPQPVTPQRGLMAPSAPPAFPGAIGGHLPTHGAPTTASAAGPSGAASSAFPSRRAGVAGGHFSTTSLTSAPTGRAPLTASAAGPSGTPSVACQSGAATEIEGWNDAVEAVYNQIQLPANWTEEDDEQLRTYFASRAAMSSDLTQILNDVASGPQAPNPPYPRRCLVQHVAHAGTAIKESGLTKRSDCQYHNGNLKRTVSDLCVTFDYVDRQMMDPIVRVAGSVRRAETVNRWRDQSITHRTQNGKRWVLIKRD